ncbi:hypothetical protein BH23BAC1_BH23BAC1_07740 [soil metagenome]
MRFILIISLIYSVFSSGMAFAQKGSLSNDPDIFIQDLTNLLAQSKNPQTIAIGDGFSNLWNQGGIDLSSKAKVVTITQKMLKKNFKVKPHLENFLLAIVNAKNLENISETNLHNLFNMTESVVDTYENKDAYNYFQVLYDFFQSKTLFNSSFSKLYAQGGNYSFEFVTDAPEAIIQEETLPQQKVEEDDGWFSDWDTNKDDDWGSTWDKGENDHQESQDFLSQLTKVEQPKIIGAVIKFENVNLTFATKFDSTGLNNTNGAFLFKKNLFVGNGGRFDWAIAGLSPDSVYCEFEEYNFDVTKVYLSAENVNLTYFGKVDKPVPGVFEYQSHRHNSPSDAKFPRFKSYNNDIQVRNLARKNLSYHGGFALAGREIYSSSVLEGIATIEVNDSGDKKFTAKSDRFNLKDTVITAQRASIVIYHQRDSLFHPSVKFRYNTFSELLTLLKDDGGFKNTPFYASYHKMDIFSDVVKWDINSDSLDIAVLNAKNQIPAVFESQEYFNELRFNNLTGLYSFHPLQMVVGYSRKIKSEEFYSQDMAKDMKQNPATIKGAMVFLMQNGLIDYDPKTDLVKINKKGIHYVLSRAERKDFDNLIIPSISPSKPNATLNLKDQQLTVRGIKKFYISEPLDVFIQPEDEEIVLLNNRDFLFNGKLNAGNYEYIGQNFRFNYDSFMVHLPSIDSIKFNITTNKKDKDNKFIKKRLDNQLVQTSGTLFINRPNNKSAKRTFAQYPIFSADKGAIVYFDGKEVMDGAYDQSVYFSIPPFEIDSVSSSDPNSIAFKGTFNSGGIFPEFEASMKIMPDNSLGFEYKTPPSGIPLYGGIGKLYSDIKFDNKGIRSNGKIEHMNATLYSEDFLFFKDSTLAVGTRMEFREGLAGNVSFPQANLDGFKMRWLPPQDTMFISSVKNPFSLYNNSANLEGTTILTPKGVFAEGKLLTRGSEIVSKKMNFEQSEFSARNADFKITTSNPKKPALSGSDVKLNFDLIKNTASISPEVEGVAALDFPYAQVRTSITKAIWNLEDKTIHMSKPEDVDINNSYFYTTRKELDSLVFNATAAVYDINQLKFNISGIPYIKVADAKITPENNQVLILENAELQELRNAVVVIDTLNEYHRLINGRIKILSRKKFEGDATYEYVNAQADTFAIKFDSFKLLEDPSKKNIAKPFTVSSGEVKESDKLLISPGMLFKGNMTMYANKESLDLDGYVKLDLKKTQSNTWINYKSKGENQEIAFDFENSLTENNEPLFAGLHIDNNTYDLYGTFLTDPRTLGDDDFFTPGGLLSFDEQKREYQIRDPKKVGGNSYAGKIFTYNEETSDIKVEGPFHFIKNQPKFTLKSAGKGIGNLDKREYVFNTFMVFNYEIPVQATEAMGADIKGVLERIGSTAAHSDRVSLMYKAAEIIGDKAAKEYDNLSLQDYTPLVNMSPELLKSLVISDVDLKWSEKNKAWYSTSKISVSNILKTDINARMDGFMEIRKKNDGGERIDLFLQASPATWYYISYEDNRLLLFSSNDEFNNQINSKSNIHRARIGEFVFATADIAETLKFVNDFRKTYFDIDVPYQLDVPSENVFEDDPFKTIQDDDEDDPRKDVPSDGF